MRKWLLSIALDTREGHAGQSKLEMRSQSTEGLYRNDFG